MNTQIVVYIVPDVQNMEALSFDSRLSGPQFVFAGLRQAQVRRQGILAVGEEPIQTVGIPSFNAIFTVPMHLVNDPEIFTIGRGMPQQPDEEFDQDLAS